MKSSPQVSVIIPAYNADRFLSRCVDSVLAQSLSDWELVIVDDGSTDGTPQLADTLARSDERIEVVHQENRGAAEARRQGLLASHGEWIMFLDADDEITPDAMAFLLARCEAEGLDMAYGTFLTIAGNKQVPWSFHQEQILEDDGFLHYLFDPACMCCLWGCVSRRAIWDHDVFPPSDMIYPSEDILIIVAASEYTRRVGLYNHIVVRHYDLPVSLSSYFEKLTPARAQSFFDALEQNLARQGKDQELSKELLMMKIDRLAFYVYPIDSRLPWIQRVIEDRRFKLPRRQLVMQRLLPYPRLLRALITANRLMRRLGVKLPFLSKD